MDEVPVTVFGMNASGQAILQQGEKFYLVTIDSDWVPLALSNINEARSIANSTVMQSKTTGGFRDLEQAIDFVRSQPIN